jgi:DNA repair protein RecN (Recombination protein N)
VLVELVVEDLGIIERLHLVLGPGLTALTGETGAGKTMLVEAIELLVGGRADPSMVRAGATEARVEGRFVTEDGDFELVIARVVPVSGRSRAYVNGRLATVASLAELTAELVDLHGQHAHQSLLSPATQRAALDRFGGIDLEPLRAARAAVVAIDAELAALGGDERSRARELDLLRHQVAELDRAEIVDPDEDERLAVEEDVLADAVAHREAGATAVAVLADDEAAADLVRRALAALGDRAPYRAVAERLAAAVADLDDVVSELRHALDAVDEDPERLTEVRTRRATLRDLCRKYGDDLAAVMAYHAEIEDRRRELEGFDERAAVLDRERRSALDAAAAAAEAVGRARRRAAPVLAAAVEDRLRALALPDAVVAVEVGEHEDDHPGDQVRFLLAANPGSPLLPLARVASGGELARAMLALRLVLAGLEAGPVSGATAGADRGSDERTLVFDEVDAGIGGAAAVAVGASLGELGARHQVLVVTHLPQVAALADRQVVVSKSVADGTTTATASTVDGDGRVDEIARMLSGEVTPAAVEHARELLDRR